MTHGAYEFPRTPADRQIARRRRACIEVLVEPHVGWHDDAAVLPGKYLDRRAFRPHQRIAFAADNHHMRARAMAVRLLVGADRHLGDMRGHLVLGHFEAEKTAAGAAVV